MRDMIGSQSQGKEKESVVLLFNSAFRQPYTDNILRILSLPTGSSIHMRYSDRNIDEQIVKSIKEKLTHYTAYIIFIDRFFKDTYGNPKYRYRALRKIKITNIELEDKTWHIDLVLDEYTTNCENLTIEGGPVFTEFPENINDGHYLIKTNLPYGITEDENAWIKHVNFFNSCQCFYSKNFIFLKVEIKNVSNKGNSFKINPKINYTLKIKYHCLNYETLPKKRIIFSFYDPLISHIKEITVSRKDDCSKIMFSSEKNISFSDKTSMISCNVGENTENEYVLEIPVTVSSIKSDYWFWILLALILLSLIAPQYLGNAFPSCKQLIGIFGDILRYASSIFIIMLIGKRVIF